MGVAVAEGVAGVNAEGVASTSRAANGGTSAASGGLSGRLLGDIGANIGAAVVQRTYPGDARWQTAEEAAA